MPTLFRLISITFISDVYMMKNTCNKQEMGGLEQSGSHEVIHDRVRRQGSYVPNVVIRGAKGDRGLPGLKGDKGDTGQPGTVL